MHSDDQVFPSKYNSDSITFRNYLIAQAITGCADESRTASTIASRAIYIADEVIRRLQNGNS